MEPSLPFYATHSPVTLRTFVKLIKQDKSRYAFLIGNKEREMFFALLRHYPVIAAAHFRTRQPSGSAEEKGNQELLEDALAEQQRENRRQLESMLAEPGRFVENDMGYTFKLSESELEWLLQILNDIRVGSWIQLGEPDSDGMAKLEPTEENIQLAWAMEIAGMFEHALMEATDAPE